MAKLPKWALELAQRVAIDEGIDKPPIISWRKSNRRLSSGHCKYGSKNITITAGTCRKDQKLVLLHELTHWLMPDREHHGPSFWDKAFALYRRYKVPMLYARTREAGYRKGAIAAYRRNRKEAA